MTLSEFKAWFDGYTEDMDGPPTEKQWKRIKKRVKEIDGVAVTERVYVDRYYPRRPYWHWGELVYSSTVSETLATGSTDSLSFQTTGDTGFNSADAMYALGKSEGARD